MLEEVDDFCHRCHWVEILLPSVCGLCESVSDTITHRDSHGVEQKSSWQWNAYPRKHPRGTFKHKRKQGAYKSHETVAPSRKLETCGHSINPCWIEWNITGFIVHSKIRGRPHSWMFPSQDSSGVLALGKMTSSTCKLCGLKRMEIMEKSERIASVLFCCHFQNIYFSLHHKELAKWLIWKKKIRCFWSLPLLTSSLGAHDIRWQPLSFFLSQQWQSNQLWLCNYAVMQNQLFNSTIISYSEEIEFINVRQQVWCIWYIRKKSVSCQLFREHTWASAIFIMMNCWPKKDFLTWRPSYRSARAIPFQTMVAVTWMEKMTLNMTRLKHSMFSDQ